MHVELQMVILFDSYVNNYSKKGSIGVKQEANRVKLARVTNVCMKDGESGSFK